MMMRRGLCLPILAHLEFWCLLCINSLQSDSCPAPRMKQNIKYAIQIICYILFFIFSYSSLDHFFHGSVVYEINHDFDNTEVPFPSINVCPSLKKNNLVNLKINEIADDFNLPEFSLQTFYIYGALKNRSNLQDIIKNYSFTTTESFYIDYVISPMRTTRNDGNQLM